MVYTQVPCRVLAQVDVSVNDKDPSVVALSFDVSRVSVSLQAPRSQLPSLL